MKNNKHGPDTSDIPPVSRRWFETARLIEPPAPPQLPARLVRMQTITAWIGGAPMVCLFDKDKNILRIDAGMYLALVPEDQLQVFRARSNMVVTPTGKAVPAAG